jgi:hypothetical protein
LVETDARYPFLAYGTDWLAFGHLTIVVLFLPALRDPKRMEPLLQMGLVICALVLPLVMALRLLKRLPTK